MSTMGKLMDDICPFTVFDAFNKVITTNNRIALMNTIGERIGVTAIVPSEFEGVPVMNNMRAWFFGYEADRQPEDIDNLWNMFEAAINYADSRSETTKANFIKGYNIVTKQTLIKWNITIAFYWIRPNSYLNLDGKNREYLLRGKGSTMFDIKDSSKLKILPDGETYLKIVDNCIAEFSKPDVLIKSFPELSHAAETSSAEEKPDKTMSKASFLKWFSPLISALKTLGGVATPEDARNQIIDDLTLSEDVINETRGKLGVKKFNNEVAWARAYLVAEGLIDNSQRGIWSLTDKGKTVEMTDELSSEIKLRWQSKAKETENNQDDGSIIEAIPEAVTNSEDAIMYTPYSDEDFLSEVFIPRQKYETLANLLKTKKNLILQGAPGVGKTFVAKRLAYSIIGEKDTTRVSMVQFHQSYSYEDFIMGFRPTKDGFELKEGPFHSFRKKTQDDADNDYFFIIDEINRGNLSKIFGELLMLIENDKRSENLRLLYTNELFSVPKNLYIIGLMNTTDRSLAMIDYALRRRFTFYEMKPAFDSDGFQKFLELAGNRKFDELIKQIKALNEAISKDESLGDGFRIGHSYFCTDGDITDEWMAAAIKFELLPLLSEYWFDEKPKVEEWTRKLRGALND